MSQCVRWVRLTFCVLGSQPASQLASCSWPANQPCDKISTCQALGWSDMWWQEELGAWPHWAPVQGPSTPTGSPWGVAYLTKARQVTQMSSAACYIPLVLCIEWLFAVFYLHCLITYSCTHCREMLYGLCSLLTNLHISFHHQSDVLLWLGTTFCQTTFITRNQKCYGKSLPKVYLSSGQPDLT